MNVSDEIREFVYRIGPVLWLDFGSLLGWMRERNVLLGGDLDLGAMWSESALRRVHEVARECGLRTVERHVGGNVQSVKVMAEVPVDVHFYRPVGKREFYTATGYLSDRLPRVVRRGITDLRLYLWGRGRRIEQGLWPYVPVVWRAPARFLGPGPVDKLYTMPRDPLALVETHYGVGWRVPNQGSWTWHTDHRSSCRGEEAVSFLQEALESRR